MRDASWSPCRQGALSRRQVRGSKAANGTQCGHGPQAEVAQAFGLELLVELGGRHLEGPEEEQRNEEEKETGEEKQPQRNAQVHMHGWDDACKADLSHGAM